VATDTIERVVLNFVYDRDHHPVAHGQLEYDCAQKRWLSTMSDICLERQAECYLAVYLERRQRLLPAPRGDSQSPDTQRSVSRP
jgi:hypothetical protein